MGMYHNAQFRECTFSKVSLTKISTSALLFVEVYIVGRYTFPELYCSEK